MVRARARVKETLDGIYTYNALHDAPADENSKSSAPSFFLDLLLHPRR